MSNIFSSINVQGNFKGKFITIEGIDGSGKSTHISYCQKLLEGYLKDSGNKVILTREPGGTALGEVLRNSLLHHSMHLNTEILLVFASRSEHINRVISPALLRGDWVLCDRFTDTTFAYQGGRKAVLRSYINVLESWIQGSFRPDLTLLFDISPEVAMMRKKMHSLDRFERKSQQFFQNARDAYLRRAAEFPKRIRIIDSSRSIKMVRHDVKLELNKFAHALRGI